MKFINITFLLILFSFYLTSQSDINNIVFRVIAINGLNIREAPAKNAKVIGGIPFLGEVKILTSREHWIRDTIGNNISYNPYENGEDYITPIAGDWVKVNYANTEGFVFNAYLAAIENPRREIIPNINIKHGLNFAGQQCFDNIHRNKSLHWFGVYKTTSSDEYNLQPIIPEYTVVENDYTWLNVNGGDRGLLFMFGVSDPSKINKKISGKFCFPYRGHCRFFSNNINDKVLYKGTDITMSNEQNSDLILKVNDQQQQLNIRAYNFSFPSSLVWKGDLDGDGQDDYIVRYGDKVIQIVMYLSSEAEGQQIVKPVAVFYAGYCC